MLKELILKKKIVFFDGDGTLYLGNQLIDGALDFLHWLNDNNIPNYICTNNSSKTPAEYAIKYKTLGLPFTEDRILTSTHPAIDILKERGLTHPYVVGTSSVISWLNTQGITHTTTHPDCILLTYDTELTYEKIVQTTQYINQNIPYFATHPDMVCPTENGVVPDIGTFILMFQKTTGRTPDFIFGKPNPTLLNPILNKHNLTLDDAVFIGDRLYTDIALGQDNALSTVLTLTGETTPDMLEISDIQPTLTVTSLH